MAFLGEVYLLALFVSGEVAARDQLALDDLLIRIDIHDVGEPILGNCNSLVERDGAVILCRAPRPVKQQAYRAHP